MKSFSQVSVHQRQTCSAGLTNVPFENLSAAGMELFWLFRIPFQFSPGQGGLNLVNVSNNRITEGN